MTIALRLMQFDQALTAVLWLGILIGWLMAGAFLLGRIVAFGIATRGIKPATDSAYLRGRMAFAHDVFMLVATKADRELVKELSAACCAELDLTRVQP
ncbi:MAG TPA: hypothetical protein VGO53_16305 [Steroidobacteraceae bacterium]|jgi:hypothetical protein|nr:hypothetical protein [Steroidobacteraceae bacterium]